MLPSGWMCMAVGLNQIGPGQISRRDAALGFAFTAQAVAAGAGQRRGGYVEIADHRRDLFSRRAFAAQVEGLTAFLLSREPTFPACWWRCLLGHRRRYK